MPGKPKVTVRQFLVSIRQMTRIAYQSSPLVFSLLMGVRIVHSLTPVAVAWITKLIFDTLAESLSAGTMDSAFDDILPLLLIQGVLLVSVQALDAAKTFLNDELSRRVRLHTSQMIYGHLLSLPGLKHFEHPRFHDTLDLASESLQYGSIAVVENLGGIVSEMLTVVSFIGVLLVLSPGLALALVVTTLPGFYVLLQIRRDRFQNSWDYNPYMRKSHYLTEVLSKPDFAKEVRLFNAGSYFLKQFFFTLDKIDSARRKLILNESRRLVGLDLFNTIVLTAAYIFVIASAFAQRITIGDVTLYIEALRRVQASLNGLSWATAHLSERAMYYTHYLELLDAVPSITVHEPQQSPVDLKQGIELKNVSFHYDDDQPWVLHNLNLTIPAGECLALVGLNGAGKTTLVKLLARFYDPTEGQILWDGVDIRHFDPDELRNRLGAVFQDFVKYDLTIRENIGLGDTEAIEDIEKIQVAARKINIDGYIESLPKGYETVLSRWITVDKEDSTEFSGGQWQKIAIARMVMRTADFLMLDEPTAALDAEAEFEIFSTFAELVAGRTSLLISHRFSTVRMADRIAVIEDGQITAEGTHEELMQQGATYARLYSMQAQQFAT